MDFYDQFELLELDRDDGVKTFHAREKATGRPVKAHLFTNVAAPYQSTLLRKIDVLPEKERVRIIARGSHLGSIYVITDKLVDHGGLLEWITAATRLIPDSPPTPRISPQAPQKTSAQTAAPPISVVTEPAGQISLNKQFADLFATGQRPVFEDLPAAPPKPVNVRIPPKPEEPPVPAVSRTVDPNEATRPLPVQPAPEREFVDHNAATQPIRLPLRIPPARKLASDPNEATQPINIPSKNVPPVKVQPTPKPVPEPLGQAGVVQTPPPPRPSSSAPSQTVRHDPAFAGVPPVSSGAALATHGKVNWVVILAAIGAAVLGGVILVVLFLQFFARRPH